MSRRQWTTASTPTLGPLMLPPHRQGMRMRFVNIPPETAEFLAQGAGKMKDAFAQIGDEATSTGRRSAASTARPRTISCAGAVRLSLSPAAPP